MTSFASTISSRAHALTVLIRIEGIGTGSDQYTFCQDAPSYADSTYIECLNDPPDLLTETLPRLGGIAEKGQVSFALVDHDGLLPSVFRIQAPSLTQLTEDLSSSGTTASVTDSSQFSTNAWYFIGAECIKVTAKPSGTSLTIERAKRGTEAEQHFADDFIYSYVPYISGRKCTISIAPINADSSADERTIGTYRISGVSLSDAYTVWTFSANTELTGLTKSIGGYAYLGQAMRGSNLGSGISTLIWRPGHEGEDTWDDGYHFLSDGSGVVQAYMGTPSDLAASLGSQHVSYSAGIEEQAGGKIYTKVLSADTRYGSSFRWSPGTLFGGTASTSTTSGTWTETDHWVDILLCILLSPSAPDDGVAASSNYNSTYGNWCCLPTYAGLGIPHTSIDWSSWLEVRARTPGYRFPGFWFGYEPVSFSELATSSFLELIGAYITQSVSTGKYVLVMPRAAQASATAAFTLTASNILPEPEPEVELNEAQYQITIAGRLRSGEEAGIAVNSLGAASRSSPSSFRTGVEEIKIEAWDLVFDAGGRGIAAASAVRALAKLQAASVTIQLVCFWDLYGMKLGDVGILTCPLIPDLSAGTSGVTSLPVMCTGIEYRLDSPSGIQLTLLTFGSGRPGNRAASAWATSRSSNTFTCTANYYSTGTSIDGTPAKDVSSFEAGDVVMLLDVLGDVAASGLTQTVVSVNAGASTITLDGSFSGYDVAGAGGAAIVPVTYASASSSQKARHVYLADIADHKIGGTQAAWQYGDL